MTTSQEYRTRAERLLTPLPGQPMPSDNAVRLADVYARLALSAALDPANEHTEEARR
ncbi:hypothetical protein [Streptomyces sp. NPDC005953]|uniref:hypothetical protein n=1 Tax=Streptomyces sp. NPDC005953 TaxID=3156719 RepID=UPI0033EA94D2